MRGSTIKLGGVIVLWMATYCLLISLSISGVLDIYKLIWLMLYTTALLLLQRFLSSSATTSPSRNPDPSQVSASSPDLKEVPNLDQIVGQSIQEFTQSKIDNFRKFALFMSPIIAIAIAIPTGLLPYAVKSWASIEAEKEIDEATKEIQKLRDGIAELERTTIGRLAEVDAALGEAERLVSRMDSSMRIATEAEQKANSISKKIWQLSRDAGALESLYEHSLGSFQLNQTIVVGSKNHLESALIAEVLAQLIERKQKKSVVRKFNLGDSLHTIQELDRGKVHLFADYSGTILSVYSSNSLNTDLQNDQNHQVHPLNLVLSETAFSNAMVVKDLGFNNPYVMIVRKGWLDEAGISLDADPSIRNFVTQLRDLSIPNDVDQKPKLWTTDDFQQRRDGLPGLKLEFGAEIATSFKTDVCLHDEKYDKLKNGVLDFTDAYTTDPQLMDPEFSKLIVKLDDGGFFPLYQCVVVANRDFVRFTPQVLSAFDNFELSTDEVRELRSLAIEQQISVTGLANNQKTQEFSKIVEVFLRQKLQATSGQSPAN